MSQSLYLDILDETLHTGVQGLSEAFINAQLRLIVDCQQADGGFRGRQGGSDLYYSDFALRTLVLLTPQHTAIDRVREFLQTSHGRINNKNAEIECFSLLNMHRMLHEAIATHEKDALLALLKSRLTNQSTSPLNKWSAYRTFLAMLCFQMLGEEMPHGDAAILAIQSLAQADGGYAERAGASMSQTNATAAAVAFLAMQNAFPDEKIAPVKQYLAAMQASDGGLKAHAEVACGDLLSTFTGLVTLAAFDGLNTIDMLGIAEFLRKMASPHGGFLACHGDDAPDVEYTYYGVGVFALLRAMRT
jgi:geranylgeranyl transferase type-2 subunit beta